MAAALGFSAAPAHGAEPVVNFESGPVRPIALSPSGKRLFVTNVPDARLEVFDVDAKGLAWAGSIQVGLEPIAVAARSDDEVWVVNHLSDSVSIVDVSRGAVEQTLLVGDEPRDIVMAAGRAFITTAHRGQRRTDPQLMGVPGATDPQLTTPGVGRADVWVFELEQPAPIAGGLPVEILTFFGDTPRALAASPDESVVYVAVFNSGNRTTTLNEGVVCNGFEAAKPCVVDGVTMPGGNPGPATNFAGAPAPEVGLIVRQEAGVWRDELGRDWSGAVRFELPDYDVFAFDPERLEPVGPPVSGVGTTLFGMSVNPRTGTLYVSNTDSQNHVRFEGSGVFAGSTVRGDLARARISVVRNGVALPVALNGHLAGQPWPTPKEAAQHSLATPLAVVTSSDGQKVYVAAFGSSRVAVLSADELEGGNFDPTRASADYIETSGGGPAGVALDEARGRLYVYTRFDNSVATVELSSRRELFKQALPTPEPPSVRDGRRFLYDARMSSSNGEASCASCHVFGDMDHLAWDLGDPDASVTAGKIPVRLPAGDGGRINGTGKVNDFHPMKGPMATQTLRGLRYSGAQHWRGDRSEGRFGSDPFSAELSFKNFVVAFPGLLGREGELDEVDMTRFTEFALSLVMPPNPVRSLDNTLTAEQRAGLEIFASTTRVADGIPVPNLGFSCQGCHRLDGGQGFFGADGRRAFQDKNQVFKIPQLRNIYQKVGMFGMPNVEFFNGGDSSSQGPQVRGFGFLHDGSVDTVARFLHALVFRPTAPDVGLQSQQERESLVALLLAFDSDLAPIVGQQVTLTQRDDAVARQQLQRLVDAAARPFSSKLLGEAAHECELVAKFATGAVPRGYWLTGGSWLPDDGSVPLELEELLDAAGGSPVTFTAVVPGSGRRLGIDRDGDGALDTVDPCPSDASLGPGAMACASPSGGAGGQPPVPEPSHPSVQGGDSSVPVGGSGSSLRAPRSSGCGCFVAPSGGPPNYVYAWLALVIAWARRFATARARVSAPDSAFSRAPRLPTERARTEQTTRVPRPDRSGRDRLASGARRKKRGLVNQHRNVA